MEVNGRIERLGPEDKGLIAVLSGEIDLMAAPRVRQAVIDALETSDKRPLIIDLREVTFIDSAGLALLLFLRKSCLKDQGGLFVLVTPKSQPERVLKLGHFDQFIPLVYDYDSIQ